MIMYDIQILILYAIVVLLAIQSRRNLKLITGLTKTLKDYVELQRRYDNLTKKR